MSGPKNSARLLTRRHEGGSIFLTGRLPSWLFRAAFAPFLRAVCRSDCSSSAGSTSTWLALLIVTGGIFVGALLLATLALASLKKGTPPVPEQALREAKLTREALKNGHH